MTLDYYRRIATERDELKAHFELTEKIEKMLAGYLARAEAAEAALRELTEPISDAGQTTADGLRHEIAQLRERNVDLMAKWGIATGRALAAESERDALKAALERRGEVIFGKEGD